MDAQNIQRFHMMHFTHQSLFKYQAEKLAFMTFLFSRTLDKKKLLTWSTNELLVVDIGSYHNLAISVGGGAGE